MQGIRLVHKVALQIEEVPTSFAALQALVDRSMPKLKVETIKCALPGLRSDLIRNDEDWREACDIANARKVAYLDLALAGKEPMSFSCSRPKDQGWAKLPKAVKAKTDETRSQQTPDPYQYGKLPCFKCATSPPGRFGTCKLCNNTGEILASAPTKYRTMLQSIQTSVETLVKRVVALRETRERERKEGTHEGIRCRICGITPIVGVRYQCSVCTDFNVCGKCEEIVPHQHFFIKLRGQKPKGDSSCPKGECNSLVLRFVKDVIGKEGDKVLPGVKFPKVWRVRNDGKVQFPEGCMLVYTNGDFGGDQVPIPPLAPGEECDLAVECIPPTLEGRYTSFWRAVTPEGIRFGHRITIDVMVVEQEEKPSKLDLDQFRELLFTHPVAMRRALASTKGDVEAAMRSLSGTLQ